MTSNQSQPMVESNTLENTSLLEKEHLPFSFARRNGVMVQDNDAATVSLICRKACPPTVFLEVQRYFQKTNFL